MSENKISASLEDYLEAIIKIIEEKKSVKAIDISRLLNVGRSSVTEALKNLCLKGLVNYGRYDVISLTEEGEKKAKEIITRHRVLTEFFIDILKIEPNEAEKNACKVEHVISQDVFQKFVSFIEFNNSFNDKNGNYIKNLHKYIEKEE